MLLAQQPSIYYVYDDLNRLVVVVDRLGNAATYTYDAVGNILRIDRFDATGLPGGVAISLFTPSAGAVGATVQVFGRGFGATIAQAGATTGPITVTAPAGSATSSRVFRVLGDVAIAPETATVRVTGHATFV